MPMIANRLRLLREERDEKQAAVAEALSISRATLSTYEKGLTPSIDNAIALAQYYGVSLDYILGLSSERSANTGGMADAFIKLQRMIGPESPTASSVMSLVDAVTVYMSSGAPCGTEPIGVWNDFMNHLACCLSLAAAGDDDQVMKHANAVAVSVLKLFQMPVQIVKNREERLLSKR